MTIIRDKNNPYILMRKDFLEDHNLSWGAKGLFAYVLTKTGNSDFPDNCQVYIDELVKHEYISAEGVVYE